MADDFPGGEPHTKSEISTDIQPVQDGTASRDENTMAQKLGMGMVDESGKGKCKTYHSV